MTDLSTITNADINIQEVDMLFSILFSLISVINPVGAIPIFLSLTGGIAQADIHRLAIKTALICISILSLSFLIGQYVLDFFSISLMSLKIAGGIIIMISGMALIQDRALRSDVHQPEKDKDPTLTPLALPFLAGPGSMSFLISLKAGGNSYPQIAMALGSILIAGLFIYLVLNSARWIKRRCGEKIIESVSKITGFIVLAIGIESIFHGLKIYIKDL